VASTWAGSGFEVVGVGTEEIGERGVERERKKRGKRDGGENQKVMITSYDEF
jgi:hypothetical protein